MNAFINEFHYDNAGGDAGEFVEIAGPAGQDLTGWSLALYNGSSSQRSVYQTTALSGTIPNLENGFGVLAFLTPGLQNGGPDGFALVDDTGAVVEFLSYEGTFEAADGPAIGLTSTDVGAQESGSTPLGFSIQRTGTGTDAADFVFFGPDTDSFAAVNTGQSFTAPGSFDLQITEIWPGNEPGSNLTGDWFEVTNLGDAAWTLADGGLFYDDESADAGNAVALSGISTIAAGEAVVFVDGSDTDEFTALWGNVLTLGQVGTHDGAGLGQGGDAVTLFLDAAGDGVDAGDIIDSEGYPDADSNGGQSFDVTLGAFSVSGAGLAVSTLGVNDEGQPAIGSPTDGVPVAPEPSAYTLELLHFADQEGGAAAIADAPNLSAVLTALRDQDVGGDGLPDNTLTLSSGDAFIPGVFYDASSAAFGSAGIADIQIQNELGVQAITLGNHEFDFGTANLAGLIDGSATGNFENPFLDGTALEDQDFAGTAFPYLSANLNFAGDANLAPLEDIGGLPASPGVGNKVTSSVLFDVNGEQIGVVGATTPTLGSISNPDGVTADPSPFDPAPSEADLDALAAEIQTEVDALLDNNPGLNKIILAAHMQQLDIEQALAARLENVDIVIAGGSNTRLFDDNDRARDGDSDQRQYPIFVTNAGGTQTVLVNTDGSYKYVGRLVIDFDADGNVIPSSYDADVSGAFATDAEGVADLGAEGLIDPEIQAIADAIEAEIIATESNVFGVSDVFLNGNRAGDPDDPADPDGVRTQETNLGNLTADANLAEALKSDATVLVSLKNGGGIRASVGETVVPPGGTEAVRLPNAELVDGDGAVVKPAGGISQNDIATTLAFNNDLVLLTLTKSELVALLEHGVGALPGVSGRFPQVSGLEFSFDPDLPAGARIQNAGIFDEDGELVAELVVDGAIAGDPAQAFRVVTLGFLAAPRFDDAGTFIGGGDGYPFPNTNTEPTRDVDNGDGTVTTIALDVADPAALARINLVALEQEGVQDGEADFADTGTEQDALAEYLAANFTAATPFDQADVGPEADSRIQNLTFRADTVFVPEAVISVAISEIMYNPASSEDDWEWVEITNTGTDTLDLAGWVLDDGNNTFHDGATIAEGTVAAGESAVLYNADDLSAEDFAAAWGAGLTLIAVTDWSANGFNNGGDTVALWSSFADYDGDQTTFANAVDVVVYDDSTPFPADDGAASISLTDLTADNDLGENWVLSAVGDATPTGTGRQSDAAGGNSGSDVGSPGGDPAAAPFEPPVSELAVSVLGALDLDGAEIVAFDPETARAFVTSGGGLQVIDASDMSNPLPVTTLAAEDLGFDSSDITSVSVRGGLIAVSRPDPDGFLDGTEGTDDEEAFTPGGQVLFYSAQTLGFLGVVQVGPLPDMLTFNDDGTVLLVANEGQSSGVENEPDAAQNPAGSVSVIQVNAANPSISAVTTLDFTDASITFESLAAKGVRVNTAAPDAAADLEPEYITIEGNTAFVSLQENNAVAVIADITDPQPFTIDAIQPLGTQDHTVAALDPSNRDDGITLATYDARGLRMPDALASYVVDGVTYYLTANEGDGRDVDESRGGDLVDGDLTNGEIDTTELSAEVQAQLADDALLGRLKFSNVDGDTDGDGLIEALHSFGARSFTIFDETGAVVFDSGSDFEVITAALTPESFNSNGLASSFDSRSDDKGPEPEAVVLGEIDGRTYAFIALERVGGIMVYDVTDPANASFDQYIRNEDADGTLIDLGPEGLQFIAPEDSPTGTAVLAVASEVSNTLTFHEITPRLGVTAISEIQGETDFTGFVDDAGLTCCPTVGVDDISPLLDQEVIVEAIVTADFQSVNGDITSDLSGFYIQEEVEDTDANPFTSEGLFIFDDFADGNPDVSVGDLVRVTGTVEEFFGQTQISAQFIEVVSTGNTVPDATEVDFPATGAMFDDEGGLIADLEAVEGMLITIPEAMSITEMFNLDRFGQYSVSSGGRLEQFTQTSAPSVDGFSQHLEDIAARTIVIDDGRTDQNPEVIEIIDGNDGVLTATDSFRMGDSLSNLTGVVTYSFDEFRLHDATGDYVEDNPRPETPEDVGGTFKVASLNVLNYFTTIDEGGALTDTGLDPRGADSDEELARQTVKLVNAIVAMDADVLGLIEIENAEDSEALGALTDAVNTALGSDVYGFVNTGVIGGDAIAQGLMYRLETAVPVGDFAVLEDFGGRDFIDPLGAGRPLNRPTLAQTFEARDSGTEVTIAVNHLKSKGSLSGDPADEAQGDGQGNNNATRTEAASILADWLASDPTGTGALRQLIVGDLNAYAREDPITLLEAAGFTDIAGDLLGDDARSFVFDGQTGTLDYVMANDAVLGDVTGVTEWHINADEADAIDYNLDFGRSPELFDGDSPARNSDHDPVIVGLDFGPAIVLGTDRPETVFGTDGNEVLDGLGGRDVYFGRGGMDAFVLGAGERDIVRDFEVGIDKLDVSAWGVQSLDELGAKGVAGRIVIRDTVSGNSAVVLDGQAKALTFADLTDESFVFAPAEDLVLTGSDGLNVLKGRAGNDLIDGGQGPDRYFGNGGEDIFVLGTDAPDKVLDFQDGADALDVSSWGTDFDSLRIVEVGRDFFFIADQNRNSAFVRSEDPDFDVTAFGEDDFIF